MTPCLEPIRISWPMGNHPLCACCDQNDLDESSYLASCALGDLQSYIAGTIAARPFNKSQLANPWRTSCLQDLPSRPGYVQGIIRATPSMARHGFEDMKTPKKS